MDLAADDSNIDGDDEDILPVTKRTMKNMMKRTSLMKMELGV